MTRLVRNTQSRDQLTYSPCPVWTVGDKDLRKYTKYLNFYDRNISYLPCRKKCISYVMKYSFCDMRWSLFFLWQEIYFLAEEIYSCHRKFISCHKNFFSCQGNLFPVTGNLFPITGNLFLVTGNLYPVTGLKKNTSCHKTFILWMKEYLLLQETNFLWQ